MQSMATRCIITALIINLSNCISYAMVSSTEFNRHEKYRKYYANHSSLYLTYEEQIDRGVFPDSEDIIRADIAIVKLFERAETTGKNFHYQKQPLPKNAKLLPSSYQEAETCQQACSRLKNNKQNYCLHIEEKKYQNFLIIDHCAKKKSIVRLPLRNKTYSAYWTYPVVAVSLPFTLALDIITLPVQLFMLYMVHSTINAIFGSLHPRTKASR